MPQISVLSGRHDERRDVLTYNGTLHEYSRGGFVSRGSRCAAASERQTGGQSASSPFSVHTPTRYDIDIPVR